MTISPVNKTYSMYSLFGSFLWGRHMAVALRDHILKDSARRAETDFTGVEFVTRAFADEFIKVQYFLETKKITVRLQGVCPAVDAMLKHVAMARMPAGR